MNINIAKLSDREIANICLKYNIIQSNELQKYTRDEVTNEITKWVTYKKENYRKRRNSSPNIMSNSENIKTISNDSSNNLKRSTSQPISINKTNNIVNTPPKATLNRHRTISEPYTDKEKLIAKEDHNLKKNYNENQVNVKNILSSEDMNKYDKLGIYPSVKRLIAIGDLHGDLRVTLLALRLAKVIPMNIFPYNVDKISWCGGDTWVIQLGDQIDRCRPDNWKKNCIEDFNDVTEDEGNNMVIIKLFQKLDRLARESGGRVLGMLGNHELMNIDRDFRYVSPKEFLEFVPENERNKKYTDDGYPYGYYHRLKVFERGGSIARHYALQKKSITIVGKNLFVHGGISHELANKYSINEINNVVEKWLLNTSNKKEDKMFNEIFRDDDDVSPFWCRLYSEDDGYGENTEKGFNELLSILNKRNKTLEPIDRVIVAHTPQFMDDRYMNSIYNDRLWRIDVGMSRAFGEQGDCCPDNKYRQIQILEILDDKICNKLMCPYYGRFPGEGIGTNAVLDKPSFL